MAKTIHLDDLNDDIEDNEDLEYYPSEELDFSVSSHVRQHFDDQMTLRYEVGALIGINSLIWDEHPKQTGYMDILEGKLGYEFFRHLRMKKETFIHVLSLITAAGQCDSQILKPSLYITLWYLGTKTTFRELGQLFGIADSTAYSSIRKITALLCQISPQIIKFPGIAEIKGVSGKFRSSHQFPGVVGALDGCHINIISPKEYSNDYINRKQTHSVNLMAICDSDLKFTFINAGQPGSLHDSTVFKRTSLYRKILNDPRSIFPTNSYHIIGDSAFELSKYILTPYRDYGNLSQNQIKYNKLLSGTRMAIENAFGYLKGRFRILKYVDAQIEHLTPIITSCCVLHNITLDFSEHDYLVEEGNLDVNNEENDVLDAEVDINLIGAEGQDKRNFICDFL